MSTPEQQARTEIDRLLQAAGWAVQSLDGVNLHAARGVAIREFPLEAGYGFADYLLYVDGKACGVVEAKKQGATLTGVEIQSARYAQGLPASLPAWQRPLPFLYESTGIETHFTQGLDPAPRARNVFAFHQPAQLSEWLKLLPLASTVAVRYAVGAMQPIDNEYTKNTFAESERVQGQLSAGYEGIGRSVEYAHQGSVTSDTHIKAHSDIDLLVVEKRFVYLEPPLQPSSPYKGDAMQDRLELRHVAEKKPVSAYPSANVDCSGGKAISLSGGSLRRKVDVVIAGWLDTPEYKDGLGEHFRGVSVLDKPERKTIQNKPFLHNFRVDLRDRLERGGLRKVIRLLKSLKYDADKTATISSYDVAAIAYTAPDDWWTTPSQQDLLLIDRAGKWLDYLSSDPAYASTLQVPNATRRIFCEAGATFAGLDELRRETTGLLNDIRQGLSRSFRKLEEARISY